MNIIATLIKDENQYLDEWITYHLKLKFDKIILFEDFDSVSHKDICDKYNNVELIPVYTIFSKDDFKHKYKKTVLYDYIKQTYSNTWCLFSDVDEFLFFNNEFEDIVDFTNFLIKQNYSAAVIKMNIMTASKRINKPNDIYSVVDTYTDSISENELNINIQKCKEHKLNLSKYSINVNTKLYIDLSAKSFFEHYPHTIKCVNNEKYYINNNIKLNHYVTKSLEEWYSKLVDRGYISYGSRKYFDDFFVVNYDMIDIYFEKFLNNNIKAKSTHIS